MIKLKATIKSSVKYKSLNVTAILHTRIYLKIPFKSRDTE